MFKSFFKVKAETPLTPIEPVAEDIHKPEVNTSPGLTPDKQPPAPKAEAPKAPKVKRPPDVVLTTPMVYKVSAPEAIEKAEALMELVTDSRPDLEQKAAEVSEKLAELDTAAAGSKEVQEKPVAQEAGAPSPEGEAPAATSEITEGEKVKITTEEGEQEGTAVKQNPDGTWEVSTKDGLVLSKVPAESLELIPGARETMVLPATTRANKNKSLEKQTIIAAGEPAQEEKLVKLGGGKVVLKFNTNDLFKWFGIESPDEASDMGVQTDMDGISDEDARYWASEIVDLGEEGKETPEQLENMEKVREASRFVLQREYADAAYKVVIEAMEQTLDTFRDYPYEYFSESDFRSYSGKAKGITSYDIIPDGITTIEASDDLCHVINDVLAGVGMFDVSLQEDSDVSNPQSFCEGNFHNLSSYWEVYGGHAPKPDFDRVDNMVKFSEQKLRTMLVEEMGVTPEGIFTPSKLETKMIKHNVKAGEKPEEAVDGEVKVGEGKGKDPKVPLAGPASSGKPLPVAGPAAEPKPEGKIGSGEPKVAEDGEVKTGAGKGSEPAVQTAKPAKGGSKTLPVAGPAAEPKPEGKIGSGEATVATSGKGVSGSKGHFGFSLEILNGVIAALKTDAKAPKGYEPIVKELKKEQKEHPKTYDKASPFKIAWSMKKKGIKPQAAKIAAEDGLKNPEAKPKVSMAPEPKGEVKPAKPGEEKPALPGTDGGPDLKASAFDKLDEIDLGGGYRAKKEKKKAEPKSEGPKEEKEPKEKKEPKEPKEPKPELGASLTSAEDKKPEGGRIVVTKDGKEVGNYPDAFGDDSPAIIKFFRELLDIKESDDKKAGPPKSEGKEEPSIKDKFKALPKVEHREKKEKAPGMIDEKEMKELGASKETLENRIEAVQTILLAYRQKGYLVAEQEDIDQTLLANQGTKMTLEAAMDAALKMAAEKTQIELLALPDAELLTLKASLPYLKVRQMSVQASKPEGLTPLNILSMEIPKSEGLSFEAAFTSHFGHLG